MSASEAITNMLDTMKVSMYRLNKLLGAKSSSHVWQYVNKLKNPSTPMCKKIIALGKEYGMSITMDELTDN